MCHSYSSLHSQVCTAHAYLTFVFSNSSKICRLMNGFCKIFFAVGRLAGLLLSIDLIIVVNWSLYLFDVCGIYPISARSDPIRSSECSRTCPRMILIMSEFMSFALNACSSVVISYTQQPNAQMSDCNERRRIGAEETLSYLLTVRFVGEDLRTHVIRRANDCRRHVISRVQHSRYAQISHFDDLAFSQKDVLSFQIAMQDALVMHVLNTGRE